MSRSLWLLALRTNASAVRRLLRALLFRAHFAECHHDLREKGERPYAARSQISAGPNGT